MLLKPITRAIPRRFRPVHGLGAPVGSSGPPSGEGDEIVLTHPLQNEEHG
jgi:hypothetical protein